MTHRTITKDQTGEIIEIVVKVGSERLIPDTKKTIHEAFLKLKKRRKHLMDPISYKLIITSDLETDLQEDLKRINIDGINPVITDAT